jgi:hypothetical protein
MEKTSKKVAVIAYPGLEYKKAIRYAQETASSFDAKILLIGVMPEHNLSGRIATAVCELAPYEVISENMERESMEFFKSVDKYCQDNGVAASMQFERGSLEDVVEKLGERIDNLTLIVVPTPARNTDYSLSLDSGKTHRASDLTPCRVVAVI